jgi:hypothetical protein
MKERLGPTGNRSFRFRPTPTSCQSRLADQAVPLVLISEILNVKSSSASAFASWCSFSVPSISYPARDQLLSRCSQVGLISASQSNSIASYQRYHAPLTLPLTLVSLFMDGIPFLVGFRMTTVNSPPTRYSAQCQSPLQLASAHYILLPNLNPTSSSPSSSPTIFPPRHLIRA